jgi:hypothetical protein
MNTYSSFNHPHKCTIGERVVVSDRYEIQDGIIILKLDGEIVASAAASELFVRVKRVADGENQGA